MDHQNISERWLRSSNTKKSRLRRRGEWEKKRRGRKGWNKNRTRRSETGGRMENEMGGRRRKRVNRRHRWKKNRVTRRYGGRWKRKRGCIRVCKWNWRRTGYESMLHATSAHESKSWAKDNTISLKLHEHRLWGTTQPFHNHSVTYPCAAMCTDSTGLWMFIFPLET